jgi:ketosteroid isomerase-like protein
MSSEATTSTPNENLVRRLFEEVFARGDLEVANQILDPQFVLHDRELAPDPELSGTDVIEDIIASTRDFFTLIEDFRFSVTDFTVTVEEQLAAEDRVVTRFRVSGKFGDKSLEIRGTSISLISGGKIMEIWSNWECGLLLKDLDLVIPIDWIRGKWPPPFKHN